MEVRKMVSIIAKISGGVFYSGVGNFVIKIFGAVGYILVLSRMSLHDYGTFVLLTSLLGPAYAIIFFSFDRIFVSKYSRLRAEGSIGRAKGLAREYYITSLFILLLSCVSGYFLRGYLSEVYNLYIIKFFWVAMFLMVSQTLMNYVSLMLESHEKFKEISIIQTIEAMVRMILVLLVFFYSTFTVTLVLFMYSVSKMVAVGVGSFHLLPILRQLREVGVKAERGVLKSIMFTIGKWEIATSLLGKILEPWGLFLIKFFVNIESVAVYDFARNIYAFASSLFPVSQVTFPIISRTSSDKEKTHLIISKAQKYAFIFQSVIFIMALVFTPVVLAYFFKQYIGSEMIIYLTLLHFISDVYKIGQTALLYAFNRQKFVFLLTPFFLLVRLALDVVLVKLIGVAGIIISWHLYGLLAGFVYNVYITKTMGIRKILWKEFFSFDSYDRLILSALVKKIRFLNFFQR